MDYKNIYHSIIENRLKTPYLGYAECHHILPRSLGGSDSKSNLVDLSAREHFVCHLLLTKMYKSDTPEGKKMIKAFMMMLWCKDGSQQRYMSSRKFQILREKFSGIQSESQSGEGNSQYGTSWCHNDITRETKKIRDGDSLSGDWKIGRVFDLDKLEIERLQLKAQSKMIKELQIETHKKQLREYHIIYNTVGFKELVKITGYDKSQENLVQSFSRHLSDFVPQPRKKRG